MSVAEQFTAGLGTILGIQATPIQNVTAISIVDMHIAQSNAAPERHGRILLNVDGVLYEIRFSFAEETYDQRTIEGFPKKRNPKASLK